MSFAPLPLEGVLILDLSRVLAGPFATQLLGDMGATVIKIEDPKKGDDTRSFAPPWWGGESAYYLSANRSKRSVAVDLKSPEGRAIVRRIAEKADVVVENFRPGTAARMGLGYEDLSRDNPRLVYVSISGFGQTGPEASRPGYDVLAQAMGGIMSLTGETDGAPTKMGISQADLVAGLYSVIGTLLGLLSRERTGKGQHVDTSLLDSQVSLLSFVALSHFATGQQPRRMGNRHASIAPYETYRASDGFFTIAVGNETIWKAFCTALDRRDLADDPRFATNPDRVSNLDELNSTLEPILAQHPVAEWIERFDAAGVPAGPILTVPEVLQHPQVLARDMVVEMEHPTVGRLKGLGVPIKLSSARPAFDMPPPLLGQHTDEVLRVFLDMKDEQIADLEARGVVRMWKPAPEASEVDEEKPEADVPEPAADEAPAEADGIPTSPG